MTMTTKTWATPTLIDLEDLLAPIPGDNPSGRSLSYEPEYDALREARRFEDDTLQGAWQRQTKLADWELVLEMGGDALRQKTKDLQIAAWMTEALTRLHGFAGLRDGFRLMHALQDRFWETYHPEIEDGDLESRTGPFIFLNDPKLLPHVICSIPLTRGVSDERYSLFRFKESRTTDNEAKKGPDKLKNLLKEGKITSRQFDDAVAQSPRALYEQLVADLKEAIAAFKDFDRSTDGHFGRDAPSLINIGKAMDEVQKLLEPFLKLKREKEPDPEPELTPPAIDASAGADGATAPAEGADGVPAVDGVVIPRRSIATGSALVQEALDYGRVLIEFREKAKELADAGTKLQENRQKYAQLQADLKKLDDEYEEVSRIIGRNNHYYQLLSQVLKVAKGAP